MAEQLPLAFPEAPRWIIRPPNYDGGPRDGFIVRAWTEDEARAGFERPIELIMPVEKFDALPASAEPKQRRPSKITKHRKKGKGAAEPSRVDANKAGVESRPSGVPPASAAPIQQPCSWHGEEACCTRCTSTTDGRGHPHPAEAKGRKRYQQCEHCGNWIEPEQWISDIQRAWFGCSWCDYYLHHASDDTRQLSSGSENGASE